MKMSFPRIFPGLVSTGVLVISAFAASGCSVTVGETRPTAPPVDGPVDQTASPLTAYLVAEGSAPVLIEGLEIHASSGVGERLTASGCGSFVKPGQAGVGFRAGATVPAALLEWASAQMNGKPAAARFAVAVASDDAWKCAVEIDAPVLGRLALQTPQGAPARLAWDMRSEPRPVGPDTLAPPEGGETTIGLLLPAVQKVREAAHGDDTTVALLLPAVQKVREAAPRSQTADYPLFPSDVAAPPLTVDIDEEAFADLFDGAGEGEREIGVLHLHASPPDIIVGTGPGGGTQHGAGGGGGAGKVSVHDISFVVHLKKEAFGSSRTTMNVIPVAGFKLLPPTTEPRLTAASARVDLLKASAEPTLVLDEVTRIINALKNQPAGSGAPQDRRDMLLNYWRGTAGAEPSFKSGLGSFLERASDVEGVWAYSKLVTAARIFEQLDTPEGRALPGADATRIARGRALSHAGLHTADEATLPMLPGRLRATSDVPGHHDYRAVHAAVWTMGDIAPMLGPIGGPSALVGVEPDEIDVAHAARGGVKIAVGDVDGDGRAFLVMLAQVLEAPTVTDAQLAALTAKSDTLVKELDALRTATEARFAATK